MRLTDPTCRDRPAQYGTLRHRGDRGGAAGQGISAPRALPVAGKDDLLEGRKNATCKECLPYMVTTGSFMSYLSSRERKRSVTLLFMPTGGGPCRLGQYCTALSHVIEKNRIENAAVFSMTDENGYAGLGSRAAAEGMAGDRGRGCRRRHPQHAFGGGAGTGDAALAEFERRMEEACGYFEGRLSAQVFRRSFRVFARRMSKIPLRQKPAEKCRSFRLSARYSCGATNFRGKTSLTIWNRPGFMVRVAPVSEYHVLQQLRGQQRSRRAGIYRAENR